MLTRLLLTSQHRQQMVEHLEECLPNEGCGLVGGRAGVSEVVIPVTNELKSSVRFQMEPLEQLEKMIWIEDHDLEILAIFHSHPKGPDIPSETDITEFAYPGTITLIWSKATGEWRSRGFQIQSNTFLEIQLDWD
jgi:proteasome lid subunit RPN8/RPN11